MIKLPLIFFILVFSLGLNCPYVCQAEGQDSHKYSLSRLDDYRKARSEPRTTRDLRYWRDTSGALSEEHLPNINQILADKRYHPRRSGLNFSISDYLDFFWAELEHWLMKLQEQAGQQSWFGKFLALLASTFGFVFRYGFYLITAIVIWYVLREYIPRLRQLFLPGVTRDSISLPIIPPLASDSLSRSPSLILDAKHEYYLLFAFLRLSMIKKYSLSLATTDREILLSPDIEETDKQFFAQHAGVFEDVFFAQTETPVGNETKQIQAFLKKHYPLMDTFSSRQPISPSAAIG